MAANWRNTISASSLYYWNGREGKGGITNAYNIIDNINISGASFNSSMPSYYLGVSCTFTFIMYVAVYWMDWCDMPTWWQCVSSMLCWTADCIVIQHLHNILNEATDIFLTLYDMHVVYQVSISMWQKLSKGMPMDNELQLHPRNT